MPEQFPQVIQVTLISAINVDPHHDEIYWPDRTGFVIDDMDPTFTVKQMDTHIRYCCVAGTFQAEGLIKCFVGGY